MKITNALFAALMLTCSLACNNDDNAEPNVTISDFEGNWTATSHIHTNNSNPAQTLDIIAMGGEIRFTTLPGGGTRTWVVFGTFSDEWDAQGTLNGNKITMKPVESTRPSKIYTFEFVGDTLILTNTKDEFDFTLSGATPVSTTTVSTFVRH